MMIPTNYLRRFCRTVPAEVIGAMRHEIVLQQWWSRGGEGPNGQIGRTIGTAAPEGEWRDVPIEGE